MNKHIASQKNLFVVLGMARCGTSAIARGLHALGIDLGKELIPADQTWNAKGFWEDTDIVYKINREVLAAIDYSWSTLHLTEKDYNQHPDVRKLRQSAINLLQKRLVDKTYWGFKDPRTANILPFWQSIFRELELKEHYIIALRNPLSSAHSYHRVTGVDVEFAMLLWLMHMLSAIDGTENLPRVMISYERLLQQPKAELQRLKQHFQLPNLTTENELDAYANQFLDKNLLNFSHAEEALQSHSASQVVPVCRKMYSLFSRVAKDEIAFQDQIFKTEWHNIKDQFMQAYPIYCYIDSLVRANKNLQRKIRTTEKSVPWKLIYPLRVIDDILRAMRKKTRQKKKMTC